MDAMVRGLTADSWEVSLMTFEDFKKAVCERNTSGWEDLCRSDCIAGLDLAFDFM